MELPAAKHFLIRVISAIRGQLVFIRVICGLPFSFIRDISVIRG
jgi:hypothetical protein